MARYAPTPDGRIRYRGEQRDIYFDAVLGREHARLMRIMGDTYAEHADAMAGALTAWAAADECEAACDAASILAEANHEHQAWEDSRG